MVEGHREVSATEWLRQTPSVRWDDSLDDL